MTPAQMEERIKRLEFCFMTFVALATGELQQVVSPEELNLSKLALAQQLDAIKSDL